MQIRKLLPLLLFGWIALLAACTQERPTQAEEAAAVYAVQQAALTSGEVGAALADKGLLKPGEALALAQLGTDIAYDIYATPALAGAGDRIVFAVLAWPGAAAPTTGLARWSKDNWASQKDIPGTVTQVLGRTAVVFDLGTFPVGTQIRAAFKLVTPTAEVWLNNGNKDWQVAVQAPAALQGIGSLQARQDGWLRKLPGDLVWTAHPLTVTVETWPEVPNIQVILHWKVGAGPVVDTPMTVDAIHFGGYGLNTRWLGAIPAAQLMPGSNLTFWVEAKSPKNTLWDSQNGKNYLGNIATPPKVGWAQVGHSAFSKGWLMPDGSYKTGYAFQAGLDNPFQSVPSSYWPPPKPAVELYVPGLTDQADALDAAKGGFVQVEVVSPFFSGKPGGAWHSYKLDFLDKGGNNWRFDWNVRQHGSPLSGPNGVVWADDGTYAYKFRISTDNGATWNWLGTAPWPAAGDNLSLSWKNLTIAPQLTVSGNPNLPAIKTGKTATQKVELVNTTNDTFTVAACSVDPPVGPLGLSAKGCPSPGKVTVLAPGKRITVTLTFKPKKVGSYAATLKVDLAAQTNPSLKGTFAVAFAATAK